MSKDPVVREIRRKTTKYFTGERKIEIVLEGLRGAVSTSDEVRILKSDNDDLKRAVAELTLEVQRRKKSLGL